MYTSGNIEILCKFVFIGCIRGIGSNPNVWQKNMMSVLLPVFLYIYGGELQNLISSNFQMSFIHQSGGYCSSLGISECSNIIEGSLDRSGV